MNMLVNLPSDNPYFGTRDVPLESRQMKEQLRREIEAATALYLANGGVIQQLSPSTTVPPESQKIRQEALTKGSINALRWLAGELDLVPHNASLRALEERGLAKRRLGNWQITARGEKALEQLP